MGFFGGSGTLPDFGAVSGRFYSHIWDSATASTIALTANQIYYIPVAIANKTWTTIGANINIAGAAGKLLRLGIYNIADGVPGTLLLDAGTTAADATGDRNIIINQPLNGCYWLAVVSDGTPTLSSCNINAKGGMFGSATSTGAQAAYYTQTFTFAPLPASASGLTAVTTTTPPRLYLKY